MSGTIEVYRHGQIKVNGNMITIITDLKAISDDLENQGPKNTKAERNIVRLAQDCQKVSKELLDLLDPFRKNPDKKRTAWKSLQAQWSKMLGKEKVNDLRHLV